MRENYFYDYTQKKIRLFKNLLTKEEPLSVLRKTGNKK